MFVFFSSSSPVLEGSASALTISFLTQSTLDQMDLSSRSFPSTQIGYILWNKKSHCHTIVVFILCLYPVLLLFTCAWFFCSEFCEDCMIISFTDEKDKCGKIPACRYFLYNWLYWSKYLSGNLYSIQVMNHTLKDSLFLLSAVSEIWLWGVTMLLIPILLSMSPPSTDLQLNRACKKSFFKQNKAGH